MRDQMLIVTGLNTGFRITELLSLIVRITWSAAIQRRTHQNASNSTAARISKIVDIELFDHVISDEPRRTH